MGKFFLFFMVLTAVYGAEEKAPTTLQDLIKKDLIQSEQIQSDFDIILDQGAISMISSGMINASLFSKIEELSYDSQSRRFFGKIGGKSISGRIQFLVSLPVLMRPLSGESVIKETDIAWKKFPSNRLTPQLASSQEDVIGKTPNNRVLQPEQPLFRSDLKDPIAIKRGSIATVTYQSGGIHISSRMEAKADGAKNETIPFQNIASKKIIYAKADSPGKATVEPMDPFLLNDEPENVYEPQEEGENNDQE